MIMAEIHAQPLYLVCVFKHLAEPEEELLTDEGVGAFRYADRRHTIRERR